MIEWFHWHNEPLLVGSLLLAAWAYALATGPWRFRLAPDTPFPTGDAARFAVALVLFYIAVGSPLDQIGERFLLSAHMVQHMTIVYAVAPLLLSGLPAWLVDRALSRTTVRTFARILTNPVSAGVIYVLTLSIWHVPAAYDYALRAKVVHVAQHLSFLLAALLMWWPLAGPSKVLPPLQPGARILYLVALGGLQMPLVAFMAFSRDVLYPTYEFAPRLTAMTPREDQVLGGAIMGVGGMFITLGLISWCFYSWYRQSNAEPAPHRRIA